MARVRTSEQSRSRSKAATLEELSRGVGKLQEFLAQLEDLGREGFPYLDAARARTELQLRECIRRTFGEKSPEFQEHRHHKLLMDTPEDTQQSIALIKSLVATLEQKKLDLQGGSPPTKAPSTSAEAPPIPMRPQMTLVPASIPTVHMIMTQPILVASPPAMSVAMTMSLEPPPATAAPKPSSVLPLESSASSGESKPQIQMPSTTKSEPSSNSPTITPAISDTPPHSVAQLATATLHPPPHKPETAPAVSPDDSRPPQPSIREPEPIMQPTPSAMPQTHEPPPIPTRPQPGFSMPNGFSQQNPTTPSPESGSNPVELVKTLCGRFHSVARQLRLRGEYRATLSVEDEVDAQDLLHALLRIEFDDIGTDEWTPSYSGGAPRTTFLLNDSRLAVIVKKTCPGLSVKGLTEQLRIDAERYRTQERCTTLLCFIYDPEGRIGNPRGLETTLTSVSKSFSLEVLVTPK
jgi:hypothetical protein